MRIPPIAILLVGVFVTCTAPYDFEVFQTEEVLVIDASLTDEVKAHSVRIGTSFPLDERRERPLSGATVWVEDTDGTRIDFVETATGLYETNPNVAGIIGHSYVLHILTNEMEFISSEETLLEPMPIDSIYGRYIGLPQDDGTFEYGIQFLLDSRGDDNLARNYRYEYDETHQITLRYGSQFAWDEERQIEVLRDTFLTDCYYTDRSEELLISTSSGLSTNSILEFPLRFVGELDEQLRFRYSLEVRQYAITPSAYQFYRELNESNQGSGSFFDEQKGFIAGNIREVNDPAFPVLGYFEVAGVGEIRDIFRASDFRDQGFRPIFGDRCKDQLDTVPRFDLALYFDTFPNNNIVYFEGEPPFNAIAAYPACTDCRIFGELTKPDFWP